MLVLTRKRHERIRIRDSIVLTVLSIHGSRVRLGIEAPAEIAVSRTESIAAAPQRTASIPMVSQIVAG